MGVHGDPELPPVTLPEEQPDDDLGNWIPIDGTEYHLKSNGREWVTAKFTGRFDKKSNKPVYRDYAYYRNVDQCIGGLFEREVKRKSATAKSLEEIRAIHVEVYGILREVFPLLHSLDRDTGRGVGVHATTPPPPMEMVETGKKVRRTHTTRRRK